jgi:hypothetical protein
MFPERVVNLQPTGERCLVFGTPGGKTVEGNFVTQAVQLWWNKKVKNL